MKTTYNQYKTYLKARRRGDWFFAYLIKMAFFPFAILMSISTISHLLGILNTYPNKIMAIAFVFGFLSAFGITKSYFFNAHRKYDGDKYQVMTDIIEEEAITNKFNGRGSNGSTDYDWFDEKDTGDLEQFYDIDNIHNEDW